VKRATSFKSALTPHRRGAQLCKPTLMNAVHTEVRDGDKMLISSGKSKTPRAMLVNERERDSNDTLDVSEMLLRILLTSLNFVSTLSSR
jgi:hypothetical protein